MKRPIVALATLLHLAPHPFGMSPVGALALYGGAFGSNRIGWLTPLIPLTVAALVFGFYDPIVMGSVFGGFALSTLAGYWLLRGERKPGRFAGAVILGAVIFYLVSNFGMWLAGMYPRNGAGLIACYVAGLPFLLKAFAADAAYTGLLFGLHVVLEGRAGEAVPA